MSEIIIGCVFTEALMSNVLTYTFIIDASHIFLDKTHCITY